MIDFKHKYLNYFKIFSILNLKWFSGKIGILFILVIILIASYFVFSGKNHQNIIVEELSNPVLRENTHAESEVFLKKIDKSLAINDSNNNVKYESFGEGGGLEGIMEDFFIDGNNLVNVHAPDINLTGQRNEIITYEVKVGDTISSIAEYHNVSIETILWANKLTEKSILKPGMKLEILPITGVKHVISKDETLNGIAVYYKADIDKIIEFNDLPADGKIIAGKVIIIPDGKMPVMQKRVAVSTRPGLAIKYGINPQAPSIITARVDTGYFIYPTIGRNWGIIHGFNGVDIATACGTPIYAAADGEVITADGSGWNGGYGKFVKIRHPNGVITLYAHMSKILVTMNENVVKDQIIGLVGTTGRSTGCHLHFEVRGATNPLARR